jgi:hypothetical protein
MKRTREVTFFYYRRSIKKREESVDQNQCPAHESPCERNRKNFLKKGKNENQMDNPGLERIPLQSIGPIGGLPFSKKMSNRSGGNPKGSAPHLNGSQNDSSA